MIALSFLGGAILSSLIWLPFFVRQDRRINDLWGERDSWALDWFDAQGEIDRLRTYLSRLTPKRDDKGRFTAKGDA